MSRLAGQREIYKVLEKEMKNQIHALQIKIIY
jgi:stress-induced morphogen